MLENKNYFRVLPAAILEKPKNRFNSSFTNTVLKNGFLMELPKPAETIDQYFNVAFCAK